MTVAGHSYNYHHLYYITAIYPREFLFMLGVGQARVLAMKKEKLRDSAHLVSLKKKLPLSTLSFVIQLTRKELLMNKYRAFFINAL